MAIRRTYMPVLINLICIFYLLLTMEKAALTGACPRLLFMCVLLPDGSSPLQVTPICVSERILRVL